MPLDLADYKSKARSAIKRFWNGGKAGTRKNIAGGMDGFKDLVADIVCANGLTRENVLSPDQPITLPGHFSATQPWDLVVVNEGRLIAAIKFECLIGSLFDEAANRLCYEALGRAMEFRGVSRKEVFGVCKKPFVGYMVLIEDAPASRAPIRSVSPHFPLLPEFRETSYAERYDILCGKLMAENFYTAAAVILSPRTASKSGAYSEMSELTGLKSFVVTLASYIAIEAVR